jgi:hypothetical protein
MAPRFHPLLAAFAIAALAATGAAADTKKPDKQNCFVTNSWQGWSAPGNSDFIYLRVGVRDIYRVDLTPGSHVRKDADRFLVSQVRGSNWICSPIDLDLTLSDHHGYREPLIARAMRKLTPEEVAAIPRKDLP